MSDSVKNIRAKVYLNNKQASGSLRQLEDDTRKIRNELKLLPRDSEEFTKKATKFKALRTELGEVKKELYGTREGMSRFGKTATTELKSVIGYAAALASAFVSARSVIDYQAELSDLRVDVQKTTDLSEAEMDILQARLDALNTRTSREELLKLTAQAGKLGVRGTADLEKFVTQADMINVALGDDLGADAVLTLGKVADVFETDLLTIGNGINKIADNSKAGAPFLAEWLSRVGGTAKATNIAAGDVLGYGATLDELGLKVEMSSTALNGFFIDFVKNSDKFGAAAGFANGELSRLIGKEGTNEGFLTFLKRLKDGSTSSADFLRKLEAVGITGDRGSQVFLALSQNIDKVRERQNLANTEMESGDSVLQEFLKRNSNFAATLEKIQKWLRATFLDSKLAQGVKTFITFLAQMLGIIEDQDGTAKKWGERIVFVTKLLVIATAGLLSYKGALQLVELWSKRAMLAEKYRTIATKASLVWTNLVIGAQSTYITLTMLATGKIKAATAAQRLWNIALAANPFTAIIGLLGAITAAYFLFREEQEKVISIEKTRQDLQKQAAASIVDEKAKLEELLAIAKNETLAKEDRLKAIKALRAIAPDYLGDLTLEKINTDEATTAVDKYIESLNRKAVAQAFHQRRSDLLMKVMEERAKSTEETMDFWSVDGFTTAAKAIITGQNIALGLAIKGGEIRTENVKGIHAEIEALNKLQAEMIAAGELDVPGSTTPTTPTDDDIVDPAKNPIEDLIAQLEAQYEAELRHEEDYLERRKALFSKYGVSPEQEEAVKQAELERLQQYLDATLLNEEEFLVLKDALEEKYAEAAAKREEEKRKQYEQTAEFREEMNRRDAASSAFNAAANAQNAEEAKNAVLNAVRAEIQAYLAKAIAGAIATEFATKGLFGAITATLAGGAVGAAFSQLVPRFNTGGYTGSGMGINDPMVPGRKITGFAHDNEYVVASEELANPNVAELVRVIENVRQSRRGGGSSGSAGTTKTIQKNVTQNIEVQALTEVVGKLAQVVSKIESEGIRAIADGKFRRDMELLQKEDEYIKSKSQINGTNSQ